MHHHPHPHTRTQADHEGPVCDHCGTMRAPDGWRAFADGAQVCAACFAELDGEPSEARSVRARQRAAA